MTNVLEYLERSAERLPDKIAIADENTEATYSQVLRNSRLIAAGLVDMAVTDAPVPVLMEKSVETVELFFGIVYAGGCYSLLDPRHPQVRLNSILDTLKPSVLITDREHEQIAAELDYVTNGGKVVYIDELLSREVPEETVNAMRPAVIEGTAPLYVNFTSGSTGTPKGVVVGHASVIEFIDTFVKVCDITEDDVIGNQAPFDFDVSVKDIYSTICVGATMQIVPRDAFPFPVKILDFVCGRKCTTLIWAVSSLCIVTTMKGFAYKIPSDVNKVIFSGEVMPIKHLNMWQEAIPDAQFINVYGPTEITCNCTYYKIRRKFEAGEQIPIGLAFPGEDVFLLGEDGQVVTADTPNVNGEICVGGVSLALGYYNNPEQTARAFTSDPRPVKDRPYSDGTVEGRIYHTGDNAYYMEDGNLMFVGRKDFQIKHMGHRIELSEIELAMEKIDGIGRCCVIYDQEKEKIIAFYEGTAEKKDIVDGLKEIVPVYMIPNKLRKVEQMPLSDHGKIDRKALMSGR